MSNGVDPRDIATAIKNQFLRSRFKLAGGQIKALAIAAARIADARTRTSESLSDLRQSSFMARPEGAIKIDPRNNPRERKRGKVATVNQQSIEIVGFLALEWVDTTGRRLPARIVDHHSDPFMKFVDAVHPFIEWKHRVAIEPCLGATTQKSEELKLSPRDGRERRSRARQKLAKIPTAKEMVRGWLRFRTYTDDV